MVLHGMAFHVIICTFMVLSFFLVLTFIVAGKILRTI